MNAADFLDLENLLADCVALFLVSGVINNFVAFDKVH
jgi:hypothetical protein